MYSNCISNSNSKCITNTDGRQQYTTMCWNNIKSYINLLIIRQLRTTHLPYTTRLQSNYCKCNSSSWRKLYSNSNRCERMYSNCISNSNSKCITNTDGRQQYTTMCWNNIKSYIKRRNII